MFERLELSPAERSAAETIRFQWYTYIPLIGGKTIHLDEQITRLVQQYLTPPRPYHNLLHVLNVSNVLHRYRKIAQNYPLLQVVDGAHDVIYNAGSHTNELDSADFLEDILSHLSVPPRPINEGRRLLLLTTDHQTTRDDTDGKLLIDADKAILASPPSVYDFYSQGIWAEYVTSGKVSEVAFRKGRADLIEKWMSGPIFLTEVIETELRPQALINLQRELEFLKAA